MAELAGHVDTVAAQLDPTHLMAFDLGGVTGHPDHGQATRAALAAATTARLPVVGWTVAAR